MIKVTNRFFPSLPSCFWCSVSRLLLNMLGGYSCPQPRQLLPARYLKSMFVCVNWRRLKVFFFESVLWWWQVSTQFPHLLSVRAVEGYRRNWHTRQTSYYRPQCKVIVVICCVVCLCRPSGPFTTTASCAPASARHRAALQPALFLFCTRNLVNQGEMVEIELKWGWRPRRSLSLWIWGSTVWKYSLILFQILGHVLKTCQKVRSYKSFQRHRSVMPFLRDCQL